MKAIAVTLLFALFGPYLVQGLSYDDFTNTTSIVDTTKIDTLNPRQRLLVQEFKKINAKYLTDAYLQSDNHVIGLFKANKWDMQRATKALKKILNWRTTNKIDQLGEAETDPELLERFPFRVDAVTKDGCPVLEIDWGKWLVADFIQSKEFVRDALKIYKSHQTQMWEKGRLATKRLAPKCDQAIILADIKGFLMKNVAEPNALLQVIGMATTLDGYYGNLYKTIICFNSPGDFITLMATLQPYIGQTAQQFNFYGETDEKLAKKHIFSLVDPEQLPPSYFGTKGVY